MSMNSKADLYECVSFGDMEKIDCKHTNTIIVIYTQLYISYLCVWQNICRIVSDTCRRPFQVFLFTDSIPTRHPLR